MTTLTTDPVASLLERLFAEADAADTATRAALAGISHEEQGRLLLSKTAYAELYGQRFADVPLAISQETGALLYMLVRGSRARSIVEFGTSFGLSTIHLAAALRDNGGGRLISSEFVAAKAARAAANLGAAGLADLVQIREGDALQTLRTDLPENVDVVLLDGAKALYPDILDLVECRLKPGAYVIADNADMAPDYLARVRSPASGYLSIAVGEEVELSMRLG